MMKQRFKSITACSLVLLMMLNLFAVPSTSALVQDTVQVIEDTDELKQLSSSKIKVTMDSDGYYALMLEPETNAFFGGEVSRTSNIDVNIGGTKKEWYDLEIEDYWIEDKEIHMSRIYKNDGQSIARFTLVLSIVNATLEGGFMKVEIKMENLSSSPQDLGAFIYWDTMIDTNDGSPFEIINNGWRNYDGDFQVSAFFKDTMHVTNADAIWMGQWSGNSKSWDLNDKMFWPDHNSRIGETVKTRDTAAGAWYFPVKVQPNLSRTISTIIGAGPKNEPPTMGDTNVDDLNGSSYVPGEDIIIQGTVTDSDSVGNTAYVMGTIDDQDPIQLGELDLSNGTEDFEVRYPLPSDLPEGEYTLKIWIMDSTGGTSGLQQAVITIDGKFEIHGQIVKAGTEIEIQSKIPPAGTIAWLAPRDTTSFTEGATMTSMTGNGTNKTIAAPNEEGDYFLYVVDSSGEIKSISVGVITVDNTPPSKPTIEPQSVNGSTGNATVKLTSAPSTGETAWLAPSGTQQFEEGATITKLIGNGQLVDIFAPSVEGSYKLFLTDAAGNVSEESDLAIHVDNTAPSIDTIVPSTTDWTNQVVTYSVQFSDPTGSGEQQTGTITQTKFATGDRDLAYFANESNGFPIVNGTFTVSESGRYTIYVQDASGNATVQSIVVENIDKQAPSAPSIHRSQASDFYNMPYTITIEPGIDLQSGVAATYYQLTSGDNTSWQLYPEPIDGSMHTITIENQGSTTIRVKSVDHAGNESSIVTSTVNINSNLVVFPSLNLSTDKEYSNQDVFVSISKEYDESYNEEADHAEVYVRLHDDEEYVLYEEDFVISAEGSYNISVMVRDRYTNETIITKSIIIDKTAPMSQDNRLQQPDLTVQSGIPVPLNFSLDTGADATDTLWLAPAGTTTFEQSDSMTTANGLADSIIPPLEDGVYYLYVVDQAGNISAASAERITVDNTPPAVYGVENGQFYEQYPTISFSDGTAVLNGQVISSSTTVTENGVYTLIVTDAVGNTVTIQFEVKNHTEIVNKDKDALNIGFGDNDHAGWVTSNLTLPTSGTEGSVITWSSSNEDIIAADGTFTMPSKHTFVTLTATITSGSVSIEQQFELRAMSDTTPPLLTLNGPEAITVEQGKLYVEQGASSFDAIDGNLSSSIVIHGFVNTDKPGIYPLTYTIVDSNGNEVELVRVITVVDKLVPASSTIPASNHERVHDNVINRAIKSAVNTEHKTVRIVVDSDVELSSPVQISLSRDQVLQAKQQNIKLLLQTNNASIEVPIQSFDSILDRNQRLALHIEQVDTSLPQNQDMVDAIANINNSISIYNGRIFDFTMKIISEDENGSIIDEQVIENFQSEEDIKLRIHVGTDAAGHEAFMSFYYNPAAGDWEYIRSSHNVEQGYVELFTNHLSIYSVMHMTKSQKQEEMAKVLNKASITIRETLQVLEDPDMDFDSAAVSAYETFTKPHTEAIADAILDEKPSEGYNYSTLYTAYTNTIIAKQVELSNDTVSPVLELKGLADMQVYLGSRYTEPGAIAIDDQDGDLTGRIVVHGTVDTSRMGRYQLIYTVTDLNGNQAELYRNVHVIAYPVIDEGKDKEELDELDTFIQILDGKGKIKVAAVENNSKYTKALPSDMKLIGAVYSITVNGDANGGASGSESGTVRIKYDSTAVTNAQALTVFVYDEVSKAWKKVGGKADSNTSTIEVKVTAPSIIALFEGKITFNDLEGHWAKDIVELLASKGIITGDQHGNFNPGIGITRAEFATIITKALQLPIAEDAAQQFVDIKEQAWYSSYIATAHKAGIVKGVSKTEYKPDRVVSRQEMSAMVVRAYSIVEDLPAIDVALIDQPFADSDNISSWAFEDVYVAKYLNLVEGRNHNNFAPKNDTLRAEAAMLIYKLLVALERI